MKDDLKVLFWNIDKKLLVNETVQLISKYDVNLLIVAEYTETYIFELSTKLQDFKEIKHLQPENKRLAVWVKNDSFDINVVFSELYYNVFKIIHQPTNTKILLVGVHLYQPELSQYNPIPYITLMNREIANQEKCNDICNTVLVGDFNLPPYHDVFTATLALNTTNSIEIAKTKFRNVHEKKHRYFYNPMWKFLGNQASLGTFYYDKSDHLHWNLIDQVLIRPELLDRFNENNIEIITHLGETQLLLRDTEKNGQRIHRIDEKQYSKHLPLFFSISLM